MTERKVPHIAYVVPFGGYCRTAACLCGWVGPQRITLTLAADDAAKHEKDKEPQEAETLIDKICFHFAQTHDTSELWAHMRRDPEAFRAAVRRAMGLS